MSNLDIQKRIVKDCIIDAPRTKVWQVFTSSEGVKSFFAPDARIDLRFEGPYELLFRVDAEVGKRGSEECRVLSYLWEEMLSFSWNAPPEFPEIRCHKTFVVLQFWDGEERNSTRLRLTHGGWRNGGRWDQVYQYFDRAWESVLANLREKFRKSS